MKAIVLKDSVDVVLDVAYYKRGSCPLDIRVKLLLGKVEYTVEDLGNYQCILRRYKPFCLGPIEEDQLDIEYASNDSLRLGGALTPKRPL